MTSCPGHTELAALLDGEVTENRAAELRDHLARCAACAREAAALRRLIDRVAAPGYGVPSDAALALAAAIPELPPPAPARRIAPWLAAGVGAGAAAALLLVAWPRPFPAEFASRGTTATWERQVGAELWALERTPRRLAPGSVATPGVPLLVRFGNLAAEPAWLLAFGVDSREQVHWIYPAYEAAGTDPQSVRLDPGAGPRALADAAVLEELPAGVLRVFLVVTRQPLRVSSVEALAPAELTGARLRARLPGSRVEELPLSVEVTAHPEVRP